MPSDASPRQGIVYARPLNKARYGSYIEGVMTAGVRNGHGEGHADTTSHKGMIHTKVPSARGAENSM
jgi:hypothetical protein